MSKMIIMIILINIAIVIICPNHLLILVTKSFVNALSYYVTFLCYSKLKLVLFIHLISVDVLEEK